MTPFAYRGDFQTVFCLGAPQKLLPGWGKGQRGGKLVPTHFATRATSSGFTLVSVEHLKHIGQAFQIWLCQPSWPRCLPVFAVYPVCGCRYFTEASQTALTPTANHRPSVTMTTALPECDVSFLSLLHCSRLGLLLAHLPLGWFHSSGLLVLLPSLLDPPEGWPWPLAYGLPASAGSSPAHSASPPTLVAPHLHAGYSI